MHTKILTSAALLSLLLACSDKPVATPAAPPPAPPVAKVAVAPLRPPTTQEKIDAILMKAVFGAGYRSATSDALADLPDSEDRSQVSSYVVTAKGTTVLKTGETVLVTGSYPVIEGEQQDFGPSEGESGGLSVYFMRQQNGVWTIIKRYENITSFGSYGNLGEVVWLMLGTDKPGLGIKSHYGNRGYSMQVLNLFDLSGNEVHDVAKHGILFQSDNEGDCIEEDAGDCWDAQSTFRMAPSNPPGAYDDLLLDTVNKTSSAPGERHEKATGKRVSKTIRSSARYHFDGKQYQVVEGENQVPPL